MTKKMKVLSILIAQVLVYLTCTNFFVWYSVVIIFSILSFIPILLNRQKDENNRFVELAIVETFFVAVLYVLYYLGHDAIVSYAILVLILIPQGVLFIRASYRGRRYVKSFNTAIHLFLLICFSIQSAKADIIYQTYPIIFDAPINAYYEALYLIWVFPFLISGKKFYTVGFMFIQTFSIFLSLLHEDFLSMRLYTAQISFILILLLKLNVEIESARYPNKINFGLSSLSSIGILTLLACYFYQIK